MNENGSMNTAKIMFTLIRSVICPGEPENSITEPLSEKDLQALYRISKAHDVAHIVSLALYRKGLLGDNEISKKFRKAQKLAVYRWENMKCAFGEISDAFEEAGIPYVPLKGWVLRSYYPEEWMRTSCDIDILVREEDLNRAADTLVSGLHYKAVGKVHYHDISLYAPSGVHLELHFSIKHVENIDGLLSKAWEYVYRVNDDSFRYDQTAEYFVFHQIAHMAYHFTNGGCGIKPFMDLYILKNRMKYNEEAVRNYCRQSGIEDFYNNVLWVTDIWFGDKTHTPLSLQIESYVLNGGAFGSLENKVTVVQAKQGGKTGYMLSRIFLPYDSLKTSYPILKKRKWLFPFMQVIRWFRLIFFGRLFHAAREMKINQNISRKQRDAMGDFLRKVGL